MMQLPIMDWEKGHMSELTASGTSGVRAWRREFDVWPGNVIWNKAPGDNRLGWFPADRIRKLD
jgi:hypothetical protein